MKKILLGLSLALLCVAGFFFYKCYHIVEDAVHPADDRRHDYALCYQQVFNHYPEIEVWHDSLRACGLLRDTMLLTAEGERRHGWIISQAAAKQPCGTTIVLHGYNDNAVRMLRYAYLHYTTLGRNVIVPEHRSHGQSDGDIITYGYPDYVDINRLWIPLAHSLYPDNHTLLHGLSMGASMTLYAAGEEIADSLRVTGFIADCGYSSLRDILSHNLRKTFPHLYRPLYRMVSFLAKERYGVRLDAADVRPALARCYRPILFIQSEGDTMLPIQYMRACYPYKQHGMKRIFEVKDSDHARVIHDHYDEYVSQLQQFIQITDSLSTTDDY